MAYSFSDIRIKAEFDLENIYKLFSKSSVNEHGMLELECSLKKGTGLADTVRKINNTGIKLFFSEDRKILFNGIIERAVSFNKQGEDILKLYAVGL